MTLSNRKPLFLALALTLAAPLAFAQSTTPQAQPTTTESSTQSTTTTQDPAAQTAQPTTTQSTTESSTTSTMPTGTQGDATAATPDPAAAAQDATAATPATPATPADPATPQKKNWSDLDVDKNGSLSVTEAASVQSLAKAFTEADANADGQLTQDEYKAYLAANGKGSATPRSGG